MIDGEPAGRRRRPPCAKAVDDREHQRRGEHPGHDQVGVRVVGQGLERVHLLGHLHGAQLGGDVGADPAGERHAGEHRAQLQHHGLADQRPDEVERHGAGEDVGGEQGEHDAGEDGDEQGDRQRIDAEPPHLDEQERAPGRGRRRAARGGARCRSGRRRDGGSQRPSMAEARREDNVRVPDRRYGVRRRSSPAPGRRRLRGAA